MMKDQGVEDREKALSDVRGMVEQLKKLKDQLAEHLTDKLDEEVPKHLVRQLVKIRENLEIYRAFNQKMREEQGIKHEDVLRAINAKLPLEDKEVAELLKEIDKFRCDVVLTQAKFYQHQMKDYKESHRPFAHTKKKASAGEKKVRKKKVKKKYKTMKEQMKWKKM